MLTECERSSSPVAVGGIDIVIAKQATTAAVEITLLEGRTSSFEEDKDNQIDGNRNTRRPTCISGLASQLLPAHNRPLSLFRALSSSPNAFYGAPLTDRAASMLRPRHKGSAAPLMFANREVQRYLATSINHLHHKARMARGLFKDFVIHSLRHTMLTRPGESGARTPSRHANCWTQQHHGFAAVRSSESRGNGEGLRAVVTLQCG